MSSQSASQRPWAHPATCTCSGHIREQPPKARPHAVHPFWATATFVHWDRCAHGSAPASPPALGGRLPGGPSLSQELPPQAGSGHSPARGPSASQTRPHRRKIEGDFVCPAVSHRLVALPSHPAFVPPSSSVALGAPGVRGRLAQLLRLGAPASDLLCLREPLPSPSPGDQTSAHRPLPLEMGEVFSCAPTVRRSPLPLVTHRMASWSPSVVP